MCDVTAVPEVIVRFTRSSELGVAWADGECEKYLLDAADSVRQGAVVVVLTSTENMVLAARTLHAEGKLPKLRIEFDRSTDEEELDTVRLGLHPNGTLDRWPPGFCDQHDDWLVRLVGAQVEQRRAKREAR